jgi:hypothetical protein
VETALLSMPKLHPCLVTSSKKEEWQCKNKGQQKVTRIEQVLILLWIRSVWRQTKQ